MLLFHFLTGTFTYTNHLDTQAEEEKKSVVSIYKLLERMAKKKREGVRFRIDELTHQCSTCRMSRG
jgi:hypothetical protein